MIASRPQRTTQSARIDWAGGLPLAVRTDLMVLSDQTELEVHPGMLVVRTPHNPGYWWGNHLFFAAPPGPGDLQRWEAAFTQHIRARQPASRHTTFSWSGSGEGLAGPFRDQGYTSLHSIVLSTLEPTTYQHTNPDVRVRMLTGPDWEALLALMVAERGSAHPQVPYTAYAKARIAEWRARGEAGLGAWFGGYLGSELVVSLGLFVEPEPNGEGPRLARFQEVLTDQRYRRRGLAGTLLDNACRLFGERFGPLRFVIVADAHAAAGRMYRSLGFEVIEHHQGLEKGGY